MYSVASCELETRGEVENTGAACRANPHAAWSFLLTCAASPFTDEHRQRMRRLAESGLDWYAVLSLAEAHGLLPIVYQRSLELDAVVPNRIRRAASNRFEQHARQTLWLAHLLFQVSDLFHKHGIESLPYKGPVLAQLLYGDTSLRQYSDIDILVRGADVHRAKLVLQNGGFTCDLELSTRQQQAYVRTGNEYTFHHVGRSNVLELQWRILPSFQAVDLDPGIFFARSQKIEIGDRLISTLGSNDLMLALCAHAAKHAWCKLSWIRDVAELGQSRHLDWSRVIDEAERLGIKRILAATFHLAEKIFDTPVPAPLRHFLDTDPAVGQIVGQLRSNLETGAEPDVESLAYFRFMTQLRERRIDRLRFWWRLTVTPSVSEWSLLQLPKSLFPLYRAVRIGRLGARLIRSRGFAL
jgi:hypothetical protein